MDSSVVLSWKVVASLFRRTTVVFLVVYLCCASALGEGRRVREAAVARCAFRTGDSARDAKLTPFYVPVDDQQMYEEGIKDYLSQMGASSDQFSVVCVEAKDKDVKCELCLYNEVSEDRKHVRQGQVLDTMLLECIEGKFTQGSIMANSQYHPICYPPPHKPTRDAKEAEEKGVSPHQHFGEAGASNTGAESCGTGGKGSGGF
ncbi:hypothetical protein BESB_074620 [Besnoitia besnoiti]|uniref:Transmembrane protein n=1 Tax=Besnoitia besnoiti TaxID=94643 RepID=A0A2A9MG05_BESBE|nr:uncharacterized protein BESB_074620 [Besnoitia besnoiti]PFH34310.1 hypothetical protein BESB_074620 [Besnoitia besnoiti]